MPGFTQSVFLGLLGILALQRLGELWLSHRNEARLLALGGREHAPRHFLFMKLTHTFWFPAMALEVLYLNRPFMPILAALAIVITLGGQLLRYAAIRTLGERWTVKIITLPNAPPVTGAIYRYIRHPNYVGVILEIAAVPLIHGAWLSALVFSFLNALVLHVRIRAEEAALGRENAYESSFAGQPRFVPRAVGRKKISAERDKT